MGNMAVNIFSETNELSLQGSCGMSCYHRAGYDVNQRSLLGSGPVSGTLKHQCRTGRLWVQNIIVCFGVMKFHRWSGQSVLGWSESYCFVLLGSHNMGTKDC